MRAYMLLPNSYTWWDPVNKDLPTTMTYAYPRYTTRSLAQTLRVGGNVAAQANQAPFKAGSDIVVSNANDEAVNLELIDRFAATRKRQSPDKVSTYQFPSSLGVKHDLLDPNQDVDVVHLVYPKLLELITAL